MYYVFIHLSPCLLRRMQDLVERLLSPISKRPLPVMGFQADDKALLNLFDSLSRVPVYLFSSLDDEPEQFESCPLHACAPAKIRLACAANLDARLQLLHSGTRCNRFRKSMSLLKFDLTLAAPRLLLRRIHLTRFLARIRQLFWPLKRFGMLHVMNCMFLPFSVCCTFTSV